MLLNIFQMCCRNVTKTKEFLYRYSFCFKINLSSKLCTIYFHVFFYYIQKGARNKRATSYARLAKKIYKQGVDCFVVISLVLGNIVQHKIAFCLLWNQKKGHMVSGFKIIGFKIKIYTCTDMELHSRLCMFVKFHILVKIFFP